MKVAAQILVVVSVVVVLCSVAAAADNDNNDDQQLCGLYLAISSTSTEEETKWGIFTGKDIPAQTPIGYPEIGIHVPNLRANSFFVNEQDESVREYMDEIATFFEVFFWVPETIGARYELAKGRAVAAIPGAGVLSAYNAKYTNADWNRTASYIRPSVGESPLESYPTRGANTQFYNTQVISLKEIAAGSEIFMEFGDSWAEQQGEKLELTKDEYKKVDQTIEHLIDFFEKHAEVLNDDSKKEVYSFVTKDVLRAAVGAEKAQQIGQMLPQDPEELTIIKKAGGLLKYSDPSIYRTSKWLEEFGFCMDNIRPGASTIPNAGRGAFATRKIKEGGLVAPVPLAHIPDKRVLTMYNLKFIKSDQYSRLSEEPIATQLFENYCYGHPQSSMVLFPSGAGVGLINHSDKPNAKLVWSNHINNQKAWFDLDPKDLINEEYQYIGLMMEIVATRDIEPGEEIFIDYGPEWKSAWEKHTNEWKSKIERGELPDVWPIKAIDMNEKYRSTPFETVDELTQPYPEHLEFKGFLMIADSEALGTLDDPKFWDNDEHNGAFQWDTLFTVRVVARTEEVDADTELDSLPYSYTVLFETAKSKTYVSGVPHKALLFVDKPGTSDQYLPFSFRHYIGIPDEVFPQGAWRNLS